MQVALGKDMAHQQAIVEPGNQPIGGLPVRELLSAEYPAVELAIVPVEHGPTVAFRWFGPHTRKRNLARGHHARRRFGFGGGQRRHLLA